MSSPRFLLLQLKRIGDAILTAPALGALRAAAPEARLTLVLAGAASGLAPAFSMVDEVLRCRPQQGRGNAWRRILGGRFDAVIDFSGSDRSAAMALASRAKIRCGLEKDAQNWLRRRALNVRSSASVRDLHTIDLHLAIVNSALAAMSLPATPRVVDFGHLRLPPNLTPPALPLPYAVVHPGTARPEKYWPAANWIVVVEHLQQHLHLPVILTGSNDPAEAAHLGDIAANAEIHANFAGRLSLLELAATLEHAAIVLGVDSAAVHLAAAFQRPEIALFGPTNPFHWRPRHSECRVLLAGCPENDSVQVFAPRMPQHSMSALQPGRVIHAINALLPRPD